MKKNANQNRQGDVWVEREVVMPKNVKRVEPTNGQWIVALGEATGHMHVVECGPGVEMFEDEQGNYWLRVTEQATALKHVKDGAQAEHDPIALAPSPRPYRIQPRQFTWHAGMARQVVD